MSDKKINVDDIYKRYMEWVNKVSDDLPEKTAFTPAEIVTKVCELVQETEESIIACFPNEEDIEMMADENPLMDPYESYTDGAYGCMKFIKEKLKSI